MKLLRRIVLLTLLVAVAAVLAISYGSASAVPEWYKVSSLSPEQTDRAAKRVEDGVIRALNLANGAHARERAAARGTTTPATQLAQETLTFTEEEINAFLHKHVYEHDQKPPQAFPWDVELPGVISNPVVALKPNEILLAATISEFERVLTLGFTPQLDAQGRLDLNLSSIHMGNLPIPEAFLSKQRTRVIDTLTSRLPALQESSKLDNTGTANRDAVEAATALLVLQALNHRPASPVVFVRTQDGGYMPMRLALFAVDQGSITVTLRVMDKADRKTTLDDLRTPYGQK